MKFLSAIALALVALAFAPIAAPIAVVSYARMRHTLRVSSRQ